MVILFYTLVVAFILHPAVKLLTELFRITELSYQVNEITFSRMVFRNRAWRLLMKIYLVIS